MTTQTYDAPPGKACSTPPRVVVCGSMGALSLMNELGERLAEEGFDVVVPAPDVLPTHADERQVAAAKREASLSHMNSIKDERTSAVLVANVDRYGSCDYVGPNSFAEIAVAVSQSRAVFLLFGLPEQYRDELTAWQVRCLNGDLNTLVGHLGAVHRPRRRGRPTPAQQDLLV